MIVAQRASLPALDTLTGQTRDGDLTPLASDRSLLSTMVLSALSALSALSLLSLCSLSALSLFSRLISRVGLAQLITSPPSEPKIARPPHRR